jgi:Protein of unknown function (DUF4231)
LGETSFLARIYGQTEFISKLIVHKKRLEPFIRFFDSEGKRNRNKERILQYLIIGFGALIPIVNVIGIPSPLSNILSSVFGSIIVMSIRFLQFEKYLEGWLIYRTTATKLANEC